MEKKQNGRITNIAVLLMCFLMLFGFMFTGTTNIAKAEEVETEKTKAQEVIDQTMFLTFRKGYTESYKDFIFACFFVPNEVLDETVTFNCFICPKQYLEKKNITENYVEKLQELNLQVILLENTDGVTAPQGKIFKYGITSIFEKNKDLEFAFGFYINDADGNRSYFTPQYGTYNTLVVSEYTNEQLIEMLGHRLDTKENFDTILSKINELVDSIWIYLVIGLGSVVVIWGAYIGIKIVVAKKKEEKIDSRALVKRLIIGIIICFVLAVGLPLLIKGLASWVG